MPPSGNGMIGNMKGGLQQDRKSCLLIEVGVIVMNDGNSLSLCQHVFFVSVLMWVAFGALNVWVPSATSSSKHRHNRTPAFVQLCVTNCKFLGEQKS